MKIRKVIFLLLTALLVLLAIFPRVTEVVNKNYVFGFDQGRDYLDVQKIVDGHKFTLIGTEIGAGNAGFKYIFHGPGYYYLLTIPYIIFKGDPYGGVVLMFIFGLTAIGIGYFTGMKMLGKFGGIIFAILLAVSPPLISQSRFIWNSFPATPFIILVYYFLFLSIKDHKYLYFAAFTSAFIYNFELAMAIPLVLSVILFSIFILRTREIKEYFFQLLAILLGFLPMLVFEARHGFQGLKSIINYLFSSGQKTSFSITSFFNASHLNAFLFNFRDAFPQLPSTFWEIILFISLIIVFIIILKKEKNTSLRKIFYYLFSLPFITYFVLSFLNNAVWQHYLNHLLIAYMLIFAYVLNSLSKKRFFIKYIFFVFMIYFLYRGFINANSIFNQDFSNYYGGTAKIKGKTDALDYIYNDAKGEKFGLFVFAPPIYTYPFDYLKNWYGMKKYNYVPHQEKKGLFYLIIEKDGERPWAHNGWMETVIKTGKILETKTLYPSDFIIQKRFQE